MNVTVAQHGDLDDMLEMLCEYQESLDNITHIDEEKSEAYLNQIFDNASFATAFIGRTSSSGQPVGFAIVCRHLSSANAEGVPLIVDLYIRPNYRLKGFGRQIFEYITRWAKTQNYSRLHWQVENLNLPAQYMFDTYNPTTSGWVGYSLDLKKE